jgi:hypothetical protein
MKAAHALLVFTATLALAAAGTTIAHAGGNMDEHDDDAAEAGPAYTGFVKDTRGSTIADARVAADIKGRGTIVTRSDILGAYRLSSFGKEIKPDDVTISCSKDGYKQARVVRRQDDVDGKTNIEIECTLRKQ